MAYDSAVKADLYAQAGIPELWIVDLTTHTITTLRQPTAGGYTLSEQKSGPESLSIQAFPDIQLKVSEILL